MENCHFCRHKHSEEEVSGSRFVLCLLGSSPDCKFPAVAASGCVLWSKVGHADEGERSCLQGFACDQRCDDCRFEL